MYSNILEEELRAKETIREGEKGAIILFDFKAAFPPMSQDFLKRILQSVGLGSEWTQLLKQFYKNNLQKLGKEEDFVARTGIRQGCPISPLLFVIAADYSSENWGAKCCQSACGPLQTTRQWS